MNQNKIKSAIEFLELCQKIAQRTNLTTSRVYGLLEDFNIKTTDKIKNLSISPLFYYEDWQKALGNNKNLSVSFRGNYWTTFKNREDILYETKRYIKIYFSLDHKHLFEGVKQLITYLISENIIHTSKSTSCVRADNVIIRLKYDDYESLKKVVKFIECNKYLQEGKNKLNPFLPIFGSVAVMYDDGRSYNKELASLIATYINTYAMEGKINFDNFVKYIKSNKEDDSIFLETFENAFFKKGKYQQILEQDTKTENLESLIKSNKDPREMLEFAIIVAFEKYSKSQAISAIENALKGDYDFFSRKGYDSQGNEIKIRSYLQANISPEQLKKYILENSVIEQDATLEDIIRNYVDGIIYKYKGCILEDALFATAFKYEDDKFKIKDRAHEYYFRGDANQIVSFNEEIRSNYNFRESVVNNIASDKTCEVVESILYKNGIDYLTKSLTEKFSDFAAIIISKINNKKYH